MKIIQLLQGGDMSVYSDSSLISGGRPVFLPESGAPWEGRMFAAYRVSRLGKDISQKFAMRYIDAFTPVVIAYPSSNSSLTPGQAKCVDSAVAIGKWLPLEMNNIRLNFRESNFSVLHDKTGIIEAVAHVSAFATIKNGDIIIPASDPYAVFDLEVDTTVRVSMNGEGILGYNVK